MNKNNVIEFKRKSTPTQITFKNYSEKFDQLMKKIIDLDIPVRSPDEFSSRQKFNIYVASLMRKYCD